VEDSRTSLLTCYKKLNKTPNNKIFSNNKNNLIHRTICFQICSKMLLDRVLKGNLCSSSNSNKTNNRTHIILLEVQKQTHLQCKVNKRHLSKTLQLTILLICLIDYVWSNYILHTNIFIIYLKSSQNINSLKLTMKSKLNEVKPSM
jgi:hypothetical protein